MSRRYTIALRLPVAMERSHLEQSLLKSPEVRQEGEGRFSSYDRQQGLRYELDLREVETRGRIYLSFEGENDQAALEAARELTNQFSQVMPVEPAEPDSDEWPGERDYEPATAATQPMAPTLPRSPALVSSRTELLPSRMGEASANRGVSLAAQLLFISVFLLAIYFGPRPVREIVIGLGVLIEIAIAIWSAVRKRRRYPEGT